MKQSVYCLEVERENDIEALNSWPCSCPVKDDVYIPDNTQDKTISCTTVSNEIFIDVSYNQLMTELKRELSSVRLMPFFSSIAAYRYMGNSSQQKQIQLIYYEFLKMFMYLDQGDINLLKLFPVHTYVYDEGTIGIEWNLNKLIVSFDIEKDPEDSCWTISSAQSAGNLSEGDYFSKTNPIETVVQNVSRLVLQQLDHLL